MSSFDILESVITSRVAAESARVIQKEKDKDFLSRTANGPYLSRDANKRWLRMQRQAWREENPDRVPPWFNAQERNKWREFRWLRQRELDAIENMALPSWIDRRISALEARIKELEQQLRGEKNNG